MHSDWNQRLSLYTITHCDQGRAYYWYHWVGRFLFLDHNRPAEVESPTGDSSNAKQQPGITLNEMIEDMMMHDMRMAGQ